MRCVGAPALFSIARSARVVYRGSERLAGTRSWQIVVPAPACQLLPQLRAIRLRPALELFDGSYETASCIESCCVARKRRPSPRLREKLVSI